MTITRWGYTLGVLFIIWSVLTAGYLVTDKKHLSTEVKAKPVQWDSYTYRHVMTEKKSLNHSFMMLNKMMAAVPKAPVAHGFVQLHIEPVARAKDSVVPQEFYLASHSSNPHSNKYLINSPSLCVDKDVFMLIVIRTLLPHVDRRMAIRDTWGASYNMPNVVMPVIFILGRTKDHTDQKDIQLENQIYQDMVQEDFIDTYGNSTVKTVMGFKWARTYCQQASYVMVANDDVIVDTFKVVPYLQTLTSESSMQISLCYLYPCCMRANVPHRDPNRRRLERKSMWRYSGTYYPAHCSGTMYIAPSGVIHRLYLMALDTPSFLPDDAWVGVLAEKLGITFSDTYTSYAGIHNVPNLFKYFNDTNYMSTPILAGVLTTEFPKKEAETIRKLWSLILGHHRDQPSIDVKRYMSARNDDSDLHIYQVAAGALLIDLIVMAFIGYIIFCRKKHKIYQYY